MLGHGCESLASLVSLVSSSSSDEEDEEDHFLRVFAFLWITSIPPASATTLYQRSSRKASTFLESVLTRVLRTDAHINGSMHQPTIHQKYHTLSSHVSNQ